MSDRRISPETANRLFHVAFLAQLVVPLLFVADLTTAWWVNGSLWWYGFGATGQAVFVFCIFWIVTVLALYFLGRYANWFSLAWLKGPLVAVYSVVFALVVLELFLQVLPQGEIKPALWPPVRQALLEPDPKLMPGVHGDSTFTGNSVGIRGPELPELNDRDQVYKIVTVGGSTTESLYLDDSEEWPHLIMKSLNAAQETNPVWVGNAGQSGRNAVDHLELMRTLPILDEADLLIFLLGLNDLQPTLAFEGETTQAVLEDNAAKFGRQVLKGGGYPRPVFPVFKRLDLFERTKTSSAAAMASLGSSLVLGRVGVGPGSYIDLRRQMRASAPTVSLPDLQLGMEEYRLRIEDIVQECESKGIRCLYLTQPSMWRSDLDEDEKKLLWFGWVGREFDPIGYVTARDAGAAMDSYNQELLNICERGGLECLDLAAAVPKDVSSFYDDVHFNEEGARTVSSFLTEYLLSTPPFSE